MSFSHTSNVPIEFLPHLGKRTAKALRTLGVVTVGQFKQMPEATLIALFGPSIKNLHAYVVHGTPAAVLPAPTLNLPHSRFQVINLSLGQKLQLAVQVLRSA
jgi:nucleotidyltransferase/DNA polymerase involved in DNA repair